MQSFFSTLSALDKLFLVSAILGTSLFLLRLVLQLFGGSDTNVGGGDVGDAGGDVHGDGADSDSGFQLLSLHTLTGFFMMFGLVGLALSRQSQIKHAEWTLFGAFLAGFLSMLLIAKIFSVMRKLQSSGNIELSNAIGKEGTVYLSISPNNPGKVQITIQDRLRIYDATSYMELKTGDRVRVVKVTENNVLMVEKA